MIWALPSIAWAASLDGLPSIVGPGGGQMVTDAVPAGDLDGDGIGDLALASPWEDAAGHESGAVWLVYDVASVEPFTPIADVGVRLAGEAAQDHAGLAIAALGDTSGDGLDDLGVGAPDASDVTPLVGKVYVVLGAERQPGGSLGDEITLLGTDRWERLGSRIFGAGDVDGDGFTEILLGSPYPTPTGEMGPGWLALMWGREGGPADGALISTRADLSESTTTADGAWALTQAGTMLGRAASAVPDQTGDGRAEILVGAPGYDPDGGSRGTALLFPFPPRAEAGLVLGGGDALGSISGTDDDALPWLIESLGDGRVVASAPSHGEGTGVVWLIDVVPGETSVDAVSSVAWSGDARGDYAGWGLAATRDLASGPLVAIGRPGAYETIGAVTLAGERDPLEITGCWAGGRAGWSVRSGAGRDPSGDDRAWLAITAPWASVNAPEDGLTYVLTAEGLGQLDVPCDGEGWVEGEDADGDGFLAAVDCDDAASWRNPGAIEVCSDGFDDDCDGAADEDCGPPAARGCGCDSASGGGVWALAIATLAVARRRSRLLTVVAGVSLAGSARAADHDALDASFARLWGATGRAELQGPVIAGDFDGDGTTDVAVANFRGIEGEFATGTVHVISGRVVEGDVDLAPANVLYGDSEHDYLGVSLAVIGGAELSGKDALVVGVDHTGLTERDNGTVVVWHSPLVGAVRTAAADADGLVRGDEPGDGFGNQVVAGDFDADGIPDVAVSAPFRDGDDLPQQGRVWIVNGPIPGQIVTPIADVATGSILGSGADSWAGWRLLMPGDLDQDGFDDLLVGSLGGEPTFAGTVHFFSGGTHGADLTLEDAAGAWTAAQPEGLFGYSMAAAPREDGAPRVLIGAPTYDEGGRVWLLDAPPSGGITIDDAAVATYAGERGAAAGRSVAIGPAVLVGEPEADRVAVLDLDLLPLATLVGVEGLGTSVAWMPDLDGDADEDAVVVAPGATRSRERQGVAAVISGARLLAGELPPGDDRGDDFDGDGVRTPDDCDDGDPRRRPGQGDTCGDGVDGDCDGIVDEDCGSGCATGGGAPVGAVAVGLVALAVVARRRWLVLLALPGCWQAPPADLVLRVPDDPAHGVVEVSATGAFEQIVIAVDGEERAGGPGPEVKWTWDTRDVADGRHLIRATGWEGDEAVDAWREINVAQATGDAQDPWILVLAPSKGQIFLEGEDVRVLLEAGDDVGLARVELRMGGEILARLPPEGPWELLWEGPPIGSYSLDAVVVDVVGNEAVANVRFVVAGEDTDAP